MSRRVGTLADSLALHPLLDEADTRAARRWTVRPLRVLWMAGVAVILAAPLNAQWIDHDRTWSRDQWDHFAAGAAVSLAMRPLLKESLNKPLTRVALTCGVAMAYETTDMTRFINGKRVGFGLMDVFATCSGALFIEWAVLWLGGALK